MTNQNHPEILTRGQAATYPSATPESAQPARPIAEASLQLARELDELEVYVSQVTERLRPALRDDDRKPVDLASVGEKSHSPFTEELYKHCDRLRGQCHRLAALIESLEL